MDRDGGVVSSIAVLIPSRDRPEQLLDACRSVLGTSEVADVLAYVDDDQRVLYEPALVAAGFGPRVRTLYGTRIGPVAAANTLVGTSPEYDIYGLITDDTRTVTPRWDKWVLDAMSRFPGSIGIVSPSHNLGDHVDMPFVSRRWVEILGWYACPDMYHYCWPILTGLIGEQTAICHAPESGFAVHHSRLHPMNAEAEARDTAKFFRIVVADMPGYVASLRRELSIAQGVTA